jgi:hypothetical protein
VDPDPHQSDKQDPDPNQSDNQDQDQDPDLWFADPQHWSGNYLMSSSNYKIYILTYEMMNINGFKKGVNVGNLIMGWAGEFGRPLEVKAAILIQFIVSCFRFTHFHLVITQEHNPDGK